METKRACFFKRIPPAFIKNFNGKLLESSILKNCAGRFWLVEVENIVGNLYFGNGWQSFVEDNSIQTGDFLVFGYDDSSEFEVKIFGTSGCEKDYDQWDKRENSIKGTAVCPCKYIRRVQNKKLALRGGTNCGNVRSKRRHSDEIETKVVFEADFCPFKLKYPHFTASWRLYNMKIPKGFARDNDLRGVVSKFFRGSSGKLWPVRINHCKDGRTYFGAGWRDFWTGNKLRKGDKCVFEFIQQNVIRVHILRATLE
ncbi:putative B3 domain-containing protein At5g66980 isoform X2 [Magnolia sinica]|uniref:putative B3 domain-containing protein At5g66980 isoform X2 n=1 Tax=Magnolia sinica TaxID=86752 RepID=UPI00265B57DC|nr:putative B3 domain-containing protein At5g66980 isoform X2 [Magnolia sinica]